MTAERDTSRIVRSWLREDEHDSADRVLMTVLDRLDTTPQRRSKWPAWRDLRMNKLALTAAATAMVLVVAIVGSTLPGIAILGPGATPSPSSSDGSLPFGPHLMDPVNSQAGEDRVWVTLTAPGWFASDSGSLTKDLGGGDRVTVVVVPGDYYTMPRSLCNWRTGDIDQRDEYLPATADGFVADLAAQTYDLPAGSRTRALSAPEDVTVSYSHGQRIVQTAREYPESDASACDQGRFCTLKDRDRFDCLISDTEPGAIDTLWAADPAPSRPYLLVIAAYGSPSPGLREEMNSLVSSMTFYIE